MGKPEEDGWELVPNQNDGWEEVPSKNDGWELVPNQKPGLPNLDSTEAKIGGRADLLDEIISKAKSGKLNPNSLSNNPALLALGGISGRAEAAITNPLLSLQKGEASPKTLLDEVISGVKGQKQGQLGDLIRTTGVGGSWNEALASSTGFLASLGLGGIATKGKVTQTADEAVKGLKTGVSGALKGTGQALDDTLKNQTGFLDDVRSAFYDAKSAASEKYGEGLEKLAADNPDKFVDIGSTVGYAKEALKDNPKLASAINRVPAFKKFLDGADTRISLKEAQDLANDLQSKISSGKLKGVGVRPDDIPLLDAVHDLKADMLEAFPDIKELRKSYGEILGNFNNVRNKLKPGSLSNAVKKNFGDVEIAKSAKELLKSNPEILSRMRNYNLLRKVGAVTGAVAGASALSGTGAYVAKKVFKG